MNCWSFLQDLLHDLGIFAIGSGLLTLLVNGWIKRLLDKDFITFKAKLEKEAYEYQTKFTKFYMERTDVIAKLFARFSQVERTHSMAFETRTGLAATERERAYREAYDAYTDFITYANDNILWFSGDCHTNIEQACITLDVLWQEHMLSPLLSQCSIDEQRESAQKIKECMEKIHGLKTVLHKEFRELIEETHGASKSKSNDGN